MAHLIVGGADPRRILLMTFSRRAAGELARRVERICSHVLGSELIADIKRVVDRQTHRAERSS